MIQVVVTGAAGRMGTQIARLVRATEGMVLHGAVERPGVAQGQDAGVVAGLGPIGVTIVDDLGKALGGADVVVDFTSHEASARHAEACAERGVAPSRAAMPAAASTSRATNGVASASGSTSIPGTVCGSPVSRRGSPPRRGGSRSSSRPT